MIKTFLHWEFVPFVSLKQYEAETTRLYENYNCVNKDLKHAFEKIILTLYIYTWTHINEVFENCTIWNLKIVAKPLLERQTRIFGINVAEIKWKN